MASEQRGCLATVLGLFQGGDSTRASEGATKAEFPYVRTARFLSPAESSFLAALRVAVADDYDLFAKVRLIDVLSVTKRTGAGSRGAFNRVVSKQLDFLLCDRATSRPVLAVELDDSSHRQATRKVRDAFVEEVLEVIGLSALRVPAARTYDPRDLSRLVKASIAELPDPTVG